MSLSKDSGRADLPAASSRPSTEAVTPWSFAGLILTYWCNASCASCYLCAGPQHGEAMGVGLALELWRGLAAASVRGCRIHLTGGEPFGDWDHLLAVCRAAHREGLSWPGGRGPLDKVETNAFWATNEVIVRQRLGALNEAGMRKLVISADPYHQQFVPIERCRLAARVAEEVLGPQRVQVRWRDWLAEGFDTAGLAPARRAEVFAKYAAAGRDRWNGRAAAELLDNVEDAHPGALARKPAGEFADISCRRQLLQSRHVHVDGAGRLIPGVCAGIVFGRAARAGDISAERERLLADWPSRPIVGRLASAGPTALLAEARDAGFRPQDAYPSKCSLCHDIRRWLARSGRHAQELAPAWFYDGPAPASPPMPSSPRPAGVE